MRLRIAVSNEADANKELETALSGRALWSLCQEAIESAKEHDRLSDELRQLHEQMRRGILITGRPRSTVTTIPLKS